MEKGQLHAWNRKRTRNNSNFSVQKLDFPKFCGVRIERERRASNKNAVNSPE